MCYSVGERTKNGRSQQFRSPDRALEPEAVFLPRVVMSITRGGRGGGPSSRRPELIIIAALLQGWSRSSQEQPARSSPVGVDYYFLEGGGVVMDITSNMV